MRVEIQNLTYCPLKCGVLHPMMHFSTCVGLELELCMKWHTNRTHLSTSGYYLLYDILKNAGFRMWPLSMEPFFVELLKETRSVSVCET